jgi:hypothetical protein
VSPTDQTPGEIRFAIAGWRAPLVKGERARCAGATNRPILRLPSRSRRETRHLDCINRGVDLKMLNMKDGPTISMKTKDSMTFWPFKKRCFYRKTALCVGIWRKNGIDERTSVPTREDSASKLTLWHGECLPPPTGEVISPRLSRSRIPTPGICYNEPMEPA